MSAQPIPETRPAFAGHGAGSSGVSYLALHPMGFSVPRRLRFARCALTAPFHHHPGSRRGCLFSVALSVRSFCLLPACIVPALGQRLRGIAPCGVRTFLSRLAPEAILCPSKTKTIILSRPLKIKDKAAMLLKRIDLNPDFLISFRMNLG